jgi:hypothetical protein
MVLWANRSRGHEPAIRRELSDVENARQPVTGRQRHDLAAPRVEERIVLHQQRGRLPRPAFRCSASSNRQIRRWLIRA